MDRKALLLGDATHATRILEIGPSHAPIAPKRDGWNTCVVDHTDQAGLRAKYHDAGVDLDAIEAVDAVWAGGKLDAAIPAEWHGGFDLLIASHVIEHIPDPVQLLVSAQTLLGPAGAVALAVPDKRYCFDVFKPHATTGDLLASHDPSGPGRHGARTLFHQAAYSAEGQFPDGRFLTAWGQHPVGAARLMGTLPDGFSHAARAAETGYIDAHAWHFTPSAFALAILELAEGGLIDWHVASITPAHGAEFFVTLRRGHVRFPTPEAREQRRLQLLLGILEEMREQIDWMALGGLLSRPALPAEQVLARHLADQVAALAATRAEHAATRAEHQARLDAIATALAPPTDAPAALGTLADITARMDAMQRQLATIVAADGTQASIMGSLEQLAARQAAQQALIDGLAAQLDAQNRMLASLTAPDGTQASIMGSLELVAARQQVHQQAIEGAAHQALEAARLAHALGGRLDAQDQALAEQRRTLNEVQATATRLDRIVAPLFRLRARFRRA